jgi:hypothetical protein
VRPRLLLGLLGLLLVLLLVLLSGCGKNPVTQRRAVDIHKDDVCAVCGMYIDASPGPRGEAYVSGRKTPLKFDSTRDFFAYILQPQISCSCKACCCRTAARSTGIIPQTLRPPSSTPARPTTWCGNHGPADHDLQENLSFQHRFYSNTRSAPGSALTASGTRSWCSHWRWCFSAPESCAMPAAISARRFASSGKG